MKIIKNVNYNEVVNSFKQEHRAEHGTNLWALRAISKTNNQCEGLWAYVELEPKEILNIFLPWHEFDCKKDPVIPKNTKMNVDVTFNKIRDDKNYSSKNPDCWAKIDHCSKQENILPIFLSTKPLLELQEYYAYSDINDQQGNLFHLDGFHRLINWGLEGGMGSIYAYVAGIK
jgi:hypothetical protein